MLPTGKFALDRHEPSGKWVQATLVEKVAGVHHRRSDAQAFAAQAFKSEKKLLHYGVHIEHEPDNPHDVNAIAVYGHATKKGFLGTTERVWKIGYLPADLAFDMVSEFISQDIPIKAELYSIYHSENGFLDFNIIVLAPPGNSHSARMKR